MIETLVFDESQITCPTNGLNPKWGGLCHSLTREAGRTVVIIRHEEDMVNDGRELYGRQSGADGDADGQRL